MSDKLELDYNNCLRVIRNDRNDTIEIEAFVEKELFNFIPRFKDIDNMRMNRKVGLDINNKLHIKVYQKALLKSILSQIPIGSNDTREAIEDLQAKI